MQLALRSGGDVDNPYIWLRLGQSSLELGDEAEAGNWLVGAMLAGGVEIFEGEDPKYWTFLKERLDRPPGGLARRVVGTRTIGSSGRWGHYGFLDSRALRTPTPQS
jgi:hypothetical protein